MKVTKIVEGFEDFTFHPADPDRVYTFDDWYFDALDNIPEFEELQYELQTPEEAEEFSKLLENVYNTEGEAAAIDYIFERYAAFNK